MTPPCTRQTLLDFQPQHRTLVGIDSDGCVFPTMEAKQLQCFFPAFVEHWHLQAIAPAVRETLAFVNLYSRTRGQNRFLALLQMADLLRQRPEARRAGVALPEFPDLRRWVAAGGPLSNAALSAAVRSSGSAELAAVLRWSEAVNERIARQIRSLPPFDGAAAALDRIARDSDILCVSQTPAEALAREWRESGLDRCLFAIAGQEVGSKSEQLAFAGRGKYPPQAVLMIGDAPGDLQAAADNQALFYPILPGREPESWQRLRAEAYDRFLADAFAGAYQQALIAEFEALLPERPPWERQL